jgi:Uma2 family endonuclease
LPSRRRRAQVLPETINVFGPSERDPRSKTHVTNPKVLIEILSEATADYDRGEKLEHYKQIPALEAVVLVDHRALRVDLWTRDADGWAARQFSGGDVVPLDAIGAVLAVDEVYAAAEGA